MTLHPPRSNHTSDHSQDNHENNDADDGDDDDVWPGGVGCCCCCCGAGKAGVGVGGGGRVEVGAYDGVGGEGRHGGRGVLGEWKGCHGRVLRLYGLSV